MCSSSINERFYLLQIFVGNVSLFYQKLDKVDATTLAVDVQFIDCPTLQIQQAGFELTRKDRGGEVTRNTAYLTVNFNAGKVYLFPINPAKLINSMRSLPLILDLYKIKSITLCPYKINKDYLGNTQVPLSGCLCDQLTMADNEINYLPGSYTIKNTFGLLDQELKPAGVIEIFLKLTCLGKYITSQYSVVEKSLLFKNHGSWNEYRCIKIPLINEDAKRAEEEETRVCMPDKEIGESELDSPPKPCNVMGLVFVCEELAKHDGYPEDIKSSMENDMTWFNSEARRKKCDDLPKVCPRGKVGRRLYVQHPNNDVPCSAGLCMNTRCLNVQINKSLPL